MSTSTEAIQTTVNAALGILQEAGVPIFILILIIFVSWFGLSVGWHQLVNIIKRIGHGISRAVRGKHF